MLVLNSSLIERFKNLFFVSFVPAEQNHRCGKGRLEAETDVIYFKMSYRYDPAVSVTVYCCVVCEGVP